jgi:L-rhamnose mutarotase
MKTYCFALDLQEDPDLIAEYKRHHEPENIWPEVLECIKKNGVLSEEIYLAGNRLFMVLRTTDDFALDAKMEADSASPAMQQWEKLMWKYQKPLPQAKVGEKWVRMEKIFEVRQ